MFLLILLLLFAACSKRTDPDAGSVRGKVILEGDRDHSGGEGSLVSFGNSTRKFLICPKNILILAVTVQVGEDL